MQFADWFLDRMQYYNLKTGTSVADNCSLFAIHMKFDNGMTSFWTIMVSFLLQEVVHVIQYKFYVRP